MLGELEQDMIQFMVHSYIAPPQQTMKVTGHLFKLHEGGFFSSWYQNNLGFSQGMLGKDNDTTLETGP